MARYYFHLRSDDHEIRDAEGRELPSLHIAKVEALRGARDTLSHDLKEGRLNLHYRLDIEDSEGAVLHVLPLQEAFHLVAPGFEFGSSDGVDQHPCVGDGIDAMKPNPRSRGRRVMSNKVLQGPGEGHTPVVLIAEDDVLVRFTTAEILRDAGYVVLEAVDASEAIALISTGHPLDLVLSDVRMPGEMDGVALSHAIKALRPHLPVVMVSSHLEPDTVHGGDAFLSKPYQPENLLKLVGQFVGAEWQTKQTRPTAS